MSNTLDMLNRAQELDSARNGRAQKMKDHATITSQMTETESVIQKMKEYRDSLEGEISTLESNEAILLEQVRELYKISKREYDTMKTAIDTALENCTHETVSQIQDSIASESDSIRILNLVEERLGLEKTGTPERKIEIKAGGQSVCEVPSTSGTK